MSEVEEIDEALERLEVEEPIRIEMRLELLEACAGTASQDLRRLMHEIDVDGSGTVNYTELRTKPA